MNIRAGIQSRMTSLKLLNTYNIPLQDVQTKDPIVMLT